MVKLAAATIAASAVSLFATNTRPHHFCTFYSKGTETPFGVIFGSRYAGVATDACHIYRRGTGWKIHWGKHIPRNWIKIEKLTNHELAMTAVLIGLPQYRQDILEVETPIYKEYGWKVARRY